MANITSSNPNWGNTLNLALSQLEKVQGKVGWFESAKYQDGAPVAYVAAIQEFGAPERSIPPRPFMRPTQTAKANEWRETAAALAKNLIKGVTTPEDVMELLTLKAEGDVSKTIADVDSPPLSPITLGARKYRQEGKKVTGATIGEIARKIKDGTLDVSGVSTKPLNDTGFMIATLTHVVEKA